MSIQKTDVERRTDEVKENESKHNLFAEVIEYPVYPDGIYPAKVKSITKVNRKPWGSSEDSQITEPAFFFLFETEDEKRFSIVTGVNYGGKRASLTKILDGIIGRHLTNEEIKQLPLDVLIGEEINLLITEEESRSGDSQNRIQSIKRTAKNKFDVESHLVKDPFVSKES